MANLKERNQTNRNHPEKEQMVGFLVKDLRTTVLKMLKEL